VTSNDPTIPRPADRVGDAAIKAVKQLALADGVRLSIPQVRSACSEAGHDRLLLIGVMLGAALILSMTAVVIRRLKRIHD
jgi:hypothetical protein